MPGLNLKVKRYRCNCAIGMHMLTGAELGSVLPFPSGQINQIIGDNVVCVLRCSSLNCTLFKNTSLKWLFRESMEAFIKDR